jgi:prepilin-type N-terminal cleavage/methylation domain-containing protein
MDCTCPRSQLRNDRGFSLIESLVVITLIGVTTAISVMLLPGAIGTAKGDSSLQHIVSMLRTAREQAISQRRTIRVAFNAPNEVVVSRVEQPGPAVTQLSRVVLEQGFQFLVFAGQPDTPDVFGRAAAVDFGGAASLQFTSEGTFVDQNGDEVNGSIFIGRTGDPLSSRAVTIFGPTALIRDWNWRGSAWVD